MWMIQESGDFECIVPQWQHVGVNIGQIFHLTNIPRILQHWMEFHEGDTLVWPQCLYHVFIGSSLSEVVTTLIRLRKTHLVRGWSPFRCLYKNKTLSIGGSLTWTWKWFWSPNWGSLGPSCDAQKTSSPSPAHLVFGNLKAVTSRSFWSWHLYMSERLMWNFGLKVLSAGIVNSPDCAYV